MTAIVHTESWWRRRSTEIYDEMDSASRDVMMQLFVSGPTWDGNLISKSGRSELIERGLAEGAHGWQWLTSTGVMIAVHCEQPRTWSDQRWYRKARTID